MVCCGRQLTAVKGRIVGRGLRRLTIKRMSLLTFIGPILFFVLPVFASDKACPSFSPGECLKHLDYCFVDQNSQGYFCREPQGRCELSWRQAITFSTWGSLVVKLRRECELQPKCKFQPPRCLCRCDFLLKGEPECDCECGGGAPPRCVSEE